MAKKKRNEDSKERRENLTLWLSVFSLVIAVFALLYGVWNDYSIRRVEYTSRGVEHRPLLEFDPKIDRIHWHGEIRVFTPPTTRVADQPPTATISFTAEPELTMRNTGDSVARVLITAATDRRSGYPVLVDALLADESLSSFSVQADTSFYKTLEILPGESHPFRMKCEINDVGSDGEFTVHYLLLYENELGNVYDTYFWVRFKYEEPLQGAICDFGAGSAFKVEKGKMPRIVDTHLSTRMYSRRDSRKILKLHRRQSERLGM